MHSPYWKLFYAPLDSSKQAEEIIPETPPAQVTTAQLLPPPSTIMGENPNKEFEGYRSESTIPSSPSQLPLVMHSTALVPADQKLKGVQSSPMDSKTSMKHNNPRSKPLLGSAKKQRRYNPYESKSVFIVEPPDLHLMDAPVFLANENEVQALVAGPKQPPVDK